MTQIDLEHFCGWERGSKIGGYDSFSEMEAHCFWGAVCPNQPCSPMNELLVSSWMYFFQCLPTLWMPRCSIVAIRPAWPKSSNPSWIRKSTKSLRTSLRGGVPADTPKRVKNQSPRNSATQTSFDFDSGDSFLTLLGGRAGIQIQGDWTVTSHELGWLKAPHGSWLYTDGTRFLPSSPVPHPYAQLDQSWLWRFLRAQLADHSQPNTM